MKPTLIYLIFIIFCFSSCISKKYGRYFNNNVDSQTTIPAAAIIETEDDASASLNNDPIVRDYRVGTSKKSVQSVSPEEEIEIPVVEKIRKRQSTHSHKIHKKNQDKKKSRKTEPIGLASIGLFSLTLLLYAAEGAIGMSTGFAAIMILIAMIGGGISIHRIKKNKDIWKGRFFGGFTIIAGLLVLILLGLAAFIEAALGNA